MVILLCFLLNKHSFLNKKTITSLQAAYWSSRCRWQLSLQTERGHFSSIWHGLSRFFDLQNNAFVLTAVNAAVLKINPALPAWRRSQGREIYRGLETLPRCTMLWTPLPTNSKNISLLSEAKWKSGKPLRHNQTVTDGSLMTLTDQHSQQIWKF